MEEGELEGNASADTDERHRGTFVERLGSFLLEDPARAVDCPAVRVRGLKADFDDVELRAGVSWVRRWLGEKSVRADR